MSASSVTPISLPRGFYRESILDAGDVTTRTVSGALGASTDPDSIRWRYRPGSSGLVAVSGDESPNDPVYAGIEVTGIPSASTDTQVRTTWHDIGTPSASTDTQVTGTPSASSTDAEPATYAVIWTASSSTWRMGWRGGQWISGEVVSGVAVNSRLVGANDMDQWRSSVWSSAQWPAYSANCVEDGQRWSMGD